MYPENSAEILFFLGFSSSEFNVTVTDNDVLLDWKSGNQQPTVQDVIDAANDLILVNGITFSTWKAEHGGDADLTRRRIAKELMDKVDAQEQALRAVVLATNARTNQIAGRLNQVLDAIDSANNLAQLQTNIGTIADLPNIPKTELRTTILSYVTSGESDGPISD